MSQLYRPNLNQIIMKQMRYDGSGSLFLNVIQVYIPFYSEHSKKYLFATKK